jgi:xylulokinase
MTLVLGVDSGTQSTKALVVDADTGRVVRSGRAPHPDGTEVHPQAWLDAFHAATDGLLDGVSALAVAGQQHGMVTLDEAGRVVRPALLWNDTRSAPQATALVAARGPGWWADRTGSVPVASFTVTKLGWLAEHEPAAADRVASVLLPHDWLSWRLAAPGSRPFTDRSDASGTGYFSPASGSWLPDVLADAFGGRRPSLPAVLDPSSRGALTPSGLPLAPGAGDNAAAALGLGAGHGDVVVSLGTSGTVFAPSPAPTADPAGLVAGFCDAAGGFLPLVCTLNAARVLTSVASLLGVDLDGLSRLALAAPPGAGGLVLLPYLDGERTPNLPDATGSLGGLTRTNLSAENLARAAVEGMLCGLAEGVDALRAQGVSVRRMLLIGGAASSPAVRAVAPSVLGAPVEVPAAGEYVALGAARQAAWMLAGSASPPDWEVDAEPCGSSVGGGADVRGTYSEYRRAVFGV